MRSPEYRAQSASGFTLVELLVAVFITAVVAAVGYGALSQAAGNRERINAQSTRLLELQRGLRILEQDLESMSPRPVREPLGNGSYAPLVANSSGLSANTLSAGSIGETSTNLSEQSTALLSLTRSGWANPAGLPRSELQRVNYLLQDDKLIRTHLPILDAAGELPTVRQELLSGVESISFRYMDAGHTWRDNWQSGGLAGDARNPQMRWRPVAIELTLVLRDLGDIVRIIEIPA
jgi:general secretion pathway protein J